MHSLKSYSVLLISSCRKFSQPCGLKHFASAAQPLNSSSQHIYKNLFPWKKRSEFVDYLISCIVYHKDGVVAINKPFGVRVLSDTKGQEDSRVKNVKYTTSLSAQEDFPYSVEDALPELKHHLNCHNLFIVKSAERYTSGLVLMSMSKNIYERIRRSFNIAKNNSIPHLIHWAITKGCPVDSARKEKVAMKFVDIGYGDEKQPVIQTTYTRNDMKRKRLKIMNVEYRALSMNNRLSTSILEIATSSSTWHFLRVYTSSRAASILGDTLYGSRMTVILGRPVKINPQNIAAYNIQCLPKAMSDKLHLPPNVEGQLVMPTMLHLRTIVLPCFEDKNEIRITAPPPFHFKWTCTQLDLLPKEILEREDCL